MDHYVSFAWSCSCNKAALHLRFSFPTPPVEIFAAGNCLFRLRPRPRPRREEITPIFLPLSVTVTARARGERYCSDNGFCREITEKESFRSLRRCLALGSRLSLRFLRVSRGNVRLN